MASQTDNTVHLRSAGIIKEQMRAWFSSLRVTDSPLRIGLLLEEASPATAVSYMPFQFFEPYSSLKIQDSKVLDLFVHLQKVNAHFCGSNSVLEL